MTEHELGLCPVGAKSGSPQAPRGTAEQLPGLVVEAHGEQQLALVDEGGLDRSAVVGERSGCRAVPSESEENLAPTRGDESEVVQGLGGGEVGTETSVQA